MSTEIASSEFSASAGARSGSARLPHPRLVVLRGPGQEVRDPARSLPARAPAPARRPECGAASPAAAAAAPARAGALRRRRRRRFGEARRRRRRRRRPLRRAQLRRDAGCRLAGPPLRRGWAASTARVERETRVESSFSALIWSATTRRMLAVVSCVSCGRSTRRGAARPASPRARLDLRRHRRSSPAASRKRPVAAASASPSGRGLIIGLAQGHRRAGAFLAGGRADALELVADGLVVISALSASTVPIWRASPRRRGASPRRGA